MGVPGNANALLLKQAAAAAGYQISRSVRLNAPDSAYLSRTPASSGNRKTWTWAGWVKRSKFGGYEKLFSTWAASTATQSLTIDFLNNDTLNVTIPGTYLRRTTQVFRDPSAWYHILVAVDTTLATAGDRVKVYVNGSQVTQFSITNNPTQNDDTGVNQTATHAIGAQINSGSFNDFFSGLLADVFLIDGQALDPTSFGEFDTNGVWQPIDASGLTFGTNGFHLPFSDNSTAAALGTDTSSNGNTWTVNNISVTAGSGNDSLVDSPTNYGTDTGAGGEVRGNYATLNPLARGVNSSQITLSNGNLDALWSSSVGYAVAVGTIGVSSGKWYWEITHTQSGTRTMIGVVQASADLTSYIGTTGPAYDSFGYTWRNGVNTAATSYGVNDVVGIALDLDNGKIWFAKNGTWLGSGNPAGNSNSVYSSLSGTYFPAISEGDGNSPIGVTCNFGQRPFAYTAPSGFKALCTTNLPTPTIADGSTVMDVALYTGNGSTQTISGLNFSPDFVWIKQRSATRSHSLVDQVRGATNELFSDTTEAELTTAQALNAFTSNGFTVGSENRVNINNGTYVAWTWDAGSSTVTNTQGSITSSVRANASAGFSVVSYTGTGANGTVGHGLGVPPGFLIVKNRTYSGTSWVCWHSTFAGTERIDLNATGSKYTDATAWNSTVPSSTVFSVGTAGLNTSGNAIIAYCFAPVAGYSSFGSYTGNGSADGPFVYTGFRPKFILVKNTSVSGAWEIYDSVRNPYNVMALTLLPNASDAEITAGNGVRIDFTSNGFKWRDSGGSINGSGNTIIYAAFAESPFSYSRAR